jgi:hypothetical protein
VTADDSSRAGLVEIAPLLLNEASWFEIEVLVDEFGRASRIRLLGNVERVGEIEELSDDAAARGKRRASTKWWVHPPRGLLEPLPAVVIAGTTAGVLVGLIAAGNPKNNTKFVLRDRPPICASSFVLATDHVTVFETRPWLGSR